MALRVETQPIKIAIGSPRSQGPRGATGPRGFKGDKGDPGNYIGVTLIGASDDLADRPTSADEGEIWGLILSQTMRLYIYSGGAWFDIGEITTPSSTPVANVIYVQGNGNNSNGGRALSNALRHIEAALEMATEAAEPTLIEWYPDPTVVTQGNLDMPDDCQIVCKHRTVIIRPDTGFAQRNVFRMGSGCFIEGMLFEGWQVDDLNDPTVGFAISFRPGAVINRVPYAHKIAVRSIPTWGIVPPPLNAATGNPFVTRGGGVALADGMICSQFSRFPNIMTWGATPVIPNGIGYAARRGGLVNAVNAIPLWCHKHFVANSGGQIIGSGCATQFGDFVAVADGVRNIINPVETTATLTVQTAAADAIEAAQTAIIDAMWTHLVSEGLTTGWTADDEAFTRRDAAVFLQCVRWTLQAADQLPMTNFARGLFDAVGDPVFDAGKKAAFIASFNKMATDINALSIATAAKTIVTALVTALNTTVDTPTYETTPSLITLIAHTFQNVMAGVALTKIPPVETNVDIESGIIETNGGKVIATGQNEKGFARLSDDLFVDPDTGLGGPAFESAVFVQTAIFANMDG